MSGAEVAFGGGGNQGLSLIEPGALIVCLIIHAFSNTFEKIEQAAGHSTAY